MYRNGKVYEEIAKVIVDIYIDYEITELPLNEVDLCTRMGVELVPYSTFSRRKVRFLDEKRPYGFFVKESREMPPTIYYNDRLDTEGAIRFSIFHELKHYVFNDDNDEKDDLADYFARHIMCPTPYIMLLDFDFPEEIGELCGISYTAACNAYKEILNRRRYHGMQVFDYEIPLIQQLDPSLLEINDYKGI